MLENLLVIILVVLAIIMIAVILLQPDRSQGLAKNANIVDEEKEGIEKFTEWIATGIPFNYNIKGFYSKLISAFINSNSIFSYFSLSFLKENKVYIIASLPFYEKEKNITS